MVFSTNSLLTILLLLKLCNLANAGGTSDPTQEASTETDEIELVVIAPQIPLNPSQLPEVIATLDLEACEVVAAPAPNRTGEIIHCTFRILGDVSNLASAAILLSTRAVDNPLLFPLSAAISSGTGFLEMFRGFHGNLKRIQGEEGRVPAIGVAIGLVGQVSNIAGLAMLSTTAPVNIGAWLTFGGNIVKFAALSTQLSALGIEKTFDNPHTTTNILFRIGIGGVVGTTSGIILGAGISANNSDWVATGIYGLGIAGFITTLELLVRDSQDFHHLTSKLR